MSDLSRFPAWLATAAGAVRYRFFLLAGAFPYCLGVAVAAHEGAALDWPVFLAGLAGIVCLSAGIEGMNEYFDSRLGGDRAFSPVRLPDVRWPLPVGVGGFLVAALVGGWMWHARGGAVLWLALGGGIGALSYLAPPVQLSRRGLGEVVIAMGYGPGLTLGGYLLQTGRMSGGCALVSAIPALLVLAMAVANEVPDFYGDRLVGKRNLVVRLGRLGAARLYGAITMLSFVAIAAGVLARAVPAWLALGLLLAPLGWWNARSAVRFRDDAQGYRRVVRGAILLYVLACSLAIACYALVPAR